MMFDSAYLASQYGPLTERDRELQERADALQCVRDRHAAHIAFCRQQLFEFGHDETGEFFDALDRCLEELPGS